MKKANDLTRELTKHYQKVASLLSGYEIFQIFNYDLLEGKISIGPDLTFVICELLRLLVSSFQEGVDEKFMNHK